MNAYYARLAGLVVARGVMERVGVDYGLTGPQVRVLAAIAVLSRGGGRATYAGIATLTGNEASSVVRSAVLGLLCGGYASKKVSGRRDGCGWVGLRVEPAGARVLALLEREARAAIVAAGQVEVGTWKRKYVRSGRFVGQWARQQAGREARQAKVAAARTV